MTIGQTNIGSHEVINIYVDLMYHWMLFAWTRVVAYENAVFAALDRRPVIERSLEVGCGRYPILSWMLLEAGVPDLTVCEVRQDSFRAAAEQFSIRFDLIERTNRLAVLSDGTRRVALHNRYSTDLALPAEQRFDLFVHEILGSIGSMQGCVEVYNQTLPLLNADAVVIPSRSRTLCAVTRRFDLGATGSNGSIPYYAPSTRSRPIRACATWRSSLERSTR